MRPPTPASRRKPAVKKPRYEQQIGTAGTSRRSPVRVVKGVKVGRK